MSLFGCASSLLLSLKKGLMRRGRASGILWTLRVLCHPPFISNVTLKVNDIIGDVIMKKYKEKKYSE